MGLMGTLREETHIILWFLLITFVGSLAIGGLVGGADILDIITGKSKYVDAIAVVNGVAIRTDTYYSRYNFRYEQYRAQGAGDLSQERRLQLENEVWDEMITEELLSHEIAKREILATDEEVIWHLTENPPAYFRQDSIFRTGGKFDPGKYRQALANPNYNWRIYEDDIRASLPRQKIVNLLASTLRVSDKEIREYYIRNNLRYNIRYVVINSSTWINDPEISASDAEIEEWYQTNIRDYAKKPERTLSYVKFSKEPSAEDSAAVLDEAIKLKNLAEAGADFAELARAYSDGPTASEGGDLGFFGRGVMVEEFEDPVFAADVNEIIAPVITKFGVHVIYIADKRTKADGSEEIRASHILLEILAGPNTLSNSRSAANLFEFDAAEIGFDAAADGEGVIIQQTPPIRNNDISPGNVGQLRDAVIFAFTAEQGALSDVLQNETGYFVFRLEEVEESTVKSLDEVKSVIEFEIEQEKRSLKAKDYADELIGRLSLSDRTLENIVNSGKNLSIKTPPSFTLMSAIRGLGKSGELSGAIVNMTPGDLTNPIIVSSNVVIAELVRREPFDEESFQGVKEDIRNEMMLALQNNLFARWIENLKNEAVIEDLRNRRIGGEHLHL
ncbi:MAG: peptidyl-prolyl cis-trans isomerase [Candidatus Marinimicrobia bacterium]|nr:peptidyl-prolyl cis-trans isomerase [Candidatus Neomarinimicrobiota bacterium]